MTQNDIADALQVDQGTVSRWERDIEKPRPANFHALRDLLFDDPGKQSEFGANWLLKRSPMSAILVGEDRRIWEASPGCYSFYRNRDGMDVGAYLGSPLNRLLDHVNREDFLEVLEDWGVLDGEALMMRIYTNKNGTVTCHQVEPVHQAGEFFGTTAFLSHSFQIADNEDVGIEKVEAVMNDAPHEFCVLHEGPHAKHILPPFR
ncbi:helix-turn-helix domain-containing protein [Ruegeria sediminis]|uniref:Helix-turn-helix domain-containing protein n=2 Tax=Ruegeria sediminis TaxID=2583820 RepID=A0ABY2WUU6_9RHOB|nr:helix-turn-helix domain-containing protein [Ruegeria sediminis]